MDQQKLKWEKWLGQAVNFMNEAANSPIGNRVKEQFEKGFQSALAAGQNLPSTEKIAQILEEKSPQLAQWFLTQTAEINNPHQIGMGLKILELSDVEVQVGMPHRWRNREQTGAIHTGALMTLAEFAVRKYWQRQLGEQLGKLHLKECRAIIHQRTYRDVIAKMVVDGEEREETLFKLRSEGEAKEESYVAIYCRKEQKVAEFYVNMTIENSLSVTGGTEAEEKTASGDSMDHLMADDEVSDETSTADVSANSVSAEKTVYTDDALDSYVEEKLATTKPKAKSGEATLGTDRGSESESVDPTKH